MNLFDLLYDEDKSMALELFKLIADKPVDFDKFMTTVKEHGMYWLTINEPPK